MIGVKFVLTDPNRALLPTVADSSSSHMIHVVWCELLHKTQRVKITHRIYMVGCRFIHYKKKNNFFTLSDKKGGIVGAIKIAQYYMTLFWIFLTLFRLNSSDINNIASIVYTLRHVLEILQQDLEQQLQLKLRLVTLINGT